MEKIFDVQTQKETIIEKKLTDEEIKIYESNLKDVEDYTKLQSNNLKNKKAAESKLLSLGLTKEDLKALGL